jgi:phosphoribosyl 1,2-cyclic phosphate phosphodiesterase
MMVYGNDKVYDRADKALRGEWQRNRLQFIPIHPFREIVLEPGIRATPLLAAHDPSEACVNWLVEAGGRSFLQAHDTGWWKDETWEYLATRKLDVVVMDCTNGRIDNERGHMGCEAVHRAKQKLEQQGTLAEGNRFIATHFSHNGGWLHSDLEAFFGPRGIEVAYDGMSVLL